MLVECLNDKFKR